MILTYSNNDNEGRGVALVLDQDGLVSCFSYLSLHVLVCNKDITLYVFVFFSGLFLL